MAWWHTEKGESQTPGDFWDQQLLLDIFPEHREYAVDIISGRYYKQFEQPKYHKNFIVTGDEEGVFPYGDVDPEVMWVQSPPMTIDKSKVDRFFPIGYAPGTREELAKMGLPIKVLRWFFSGQSTHKRRKECIKALKTKDDGFLLETKGFTQGLDRHEYMLGLHGAMVAPCPSGAVIPDTFRLYEALEAGCYPIVDGLDPKGGSKGYWEFLFDGDVPFTVLDDWADLPGTIDYFCDTYPKHQNECSAWWQLYKRDLRYNLMEDLGQTNTQEITVLMPTSVIPSHPSTEIIDETIASVRHFLPEAEILLMIDGLRSEQSDRYDDYEEYKRRILWKSAHEWDNVTPILFSEFSHQATMTRETLKKVNTPTVLFVEHDTPLTTDCEIPFDEIIQIIQKDQADIIRLNHESHVLSEHESLYLDENAQGTSGIPLRRTAQWSQRPHVGNTTYYRRMLEDNFARTAKTMIEDKMHGVVQQKYDLLGKAGWNQNRLFMYAPEGNQKRSYTTDGRKDDPKFEMIWD